MSMLVLMLSAGEAVVLLTLVVIVARLRGRMREGNTDSTATLMQMQELVQEAQSLSTLLASQLAAQVKLTEQVTMSARKPVISAERPAGVPVAAAAAKVAAAAASRATVSDGRVLDSDTARERGMDPLGLALQRSLHRSAQPAS